MSPQSTANGRMYWQDLYVEAVLETDDSKLLAKIDAAQQAIDARVKEVDNHASTEERTALSDACSALRVLRKERLH
jgi:ABC-type branched-subunit amino acid transport system substrate-binding protein